MKHYLTLAIGCLATVSVVNAAPPSTARQTAAQVAKEEFARTGRSISPDGKHRLVLRTGQDGTEVKFVDDSEFERQVQNPLNVSRLDVKAYWALDSRSFVLAAPPTSGTPRFHLMVLNEGHFSEKNLPFAELPANHVLASPHRVIQNRESFCKWLRDGAFTTNQIVTLQERSADGNELLQKFKTIEFTLTYSSPSTPDFKVVKTQLVRSSTGKL